MLRTIFIMFCTVVMSTASANVQQSEQEKFIAQKFIEYANQYDAKKLATLYDFEELGIRMASSMGYGKEETENWVKGFTSNAPETIIQHLFAQFLIDKGRIVNPYYVTKDIIGPMMRMDLQEGGSNYYILIIEKNKHGNLKIVDMFSATQDKLLSELLGAAGQIFSNPNPSMLGRLFGNKTIVDKALAQQFQKIGELKIAGNYQQAHQIVQGLPAKIRKEKLIMTLSMSLSMYISDEQYSQDLSALAEEHGDDPSLAFVLTDHYFLQEDYEKAFQVIDSFEKHYQADGQTSVLKSTYRYFQNDLPQAKQLAEKCMKLESELIDCYWLMIQINLTMQDYPSVITTLEAITNGFGIEFDTGYFVENEIYADFIKTKEYQHWINSL